jgi:hypothetical protein
MRSDPLSWILVSPQRLRTTRLKDREKLNVDRIRN